MHHTTIERVSVSAYRVPTDGPDGLETDGTLAWDSTTLIVVEVTAAGKVGLGYSYGDVSAAHVIDSRLKHVLIGQDPFQCGLLWKRQQQLLRNDGRSGVAALAMSATDIALWDLKARLLETAVYQLLGGFRSSVEAYGSGGFCNYSLDRLTHQLSEFARLGVRAVKIKTSRDPERDPQRLTACRSVLGDAVTLMADANGALSRKRALYWAHRFHEEWNVSWFEEPVSSEDRSGLRQLRDRSPAGLEIAAGEYGFVLRDFVDLLEAGSVDCLQADVTRAGGLTGLRQVGALCRAYSLELSAHCAPSVSMHAMCGIETARHVEYFHDHARIEHLLFDGAATPVDGQLRPDPARLGFGLELKRADAERYRIFGSAHPS